MKTALLDATSFVGFASSATVRRRLSDVRGPNTVVCLTTVARRTQGERAIATFVTHHPATATKLIVVDDLVEADGAGFVSSCFPPRVFARLAMAHDAHQLVSAVRPTVLRSLLATAGPTVIVMPDDAETFAPLDALGSSDAPVTLVHTRFGPPPADGQLPDAIDAAMRGRLDQDLFALRADDPRADQFLQDWAERLIASPHIPIERLNPVTYPWLDALAELDGVVTVTKPAFPLSVRNADEPERSETPALVRWPGFDPEVPWILSSETGTLPRVRPSNHTVLADLAEKRAAALSTATVRGVLAFARLPDGTSVDNLVRRAYADGLRQFAAGNEDEPPNPFAGDSTESFLAWLRADDRYLRAFRAEHPELADVLVTDDDVRHWLVDLGAKAGVPRSLRPKPEPPAELGPGLEIRGYLHAAFGMGEAARSLVEAARETGVPVRANADRASVYDDQAEHHEEPRRDAPPRTLVLVRNADALLANPADAIAARAAGRRVIGYWFWEVANFPDRLRRAFGLVDEIWCATPFVADALRAHTDSPPVYELPYSIAAPTDLATRRDDRAAFVRAQSIPEDRFVVSFSFDYASVADRKNPWGAVAAYRKAFPEPNVALADGRIPLLILKAIGGDRHPIEVDRLRHAIGGRPDVLVIDHHLDCAEQRGLFARSDVYLSLHRGEGLGLTIAEAMAAGAPVVCTDYAGPLSFVTADTVFLVPYELVDIPASTPVYAGCGQWAEPDIDAAADYLRRIADDPAVGEQQATRAVAHLARLHPERRRQLTSFLTDRLVAPETEHLEPEVPMTEPTPPPIEATIPDGLGPVVLPGAPAPSRASSSGVLGAVGDRVRIVVEPMLAAQAAFEQQRIVALVDAVQQTRQGVLDLETRARAERETLTEAIGGVATHTANLQTNHESLYATVTDLSTQTRLLNDSHLDVHAAIARIDARLDDLTHQLQAILDRLT